MGSIDEPTGRLRPKKKSSFGQPKDSWGFGKRKVDGNFGENISKKQSSTRSSYTSKKKTSLNKKHVRKKRYELVLREYCSWLKNEYEGRDIHHWVPRSKIGRNDFFVVMLDHEYHINTVHGEMSPSGYVEKVGRKTLMQNSINMFRLWMNSDSCSEFNRGFFEPMILFMEKDITCDAEQLTKNYGTELYYNDNPPK